MKKARCGCTHPATPHFAGGAHHRRTMANTRRESTAPCRSENAIESAGSGPIPALGFGPHHSTLVDAVCQEFNHLKLPIREPMISCIARAVDMAFDSHSRTHGSTTS